MESKRRLWLSYKWDRPIPYKVSELAETLRV